MIPPLGASERASGWTRPPKPFHELASIQPGKHLARSVAMPQKKADHFQPSAFRRTFFTTRPQHHRPLDSTACPRSRPVQPRLLFRQRRRSPRSDPARSNVPAGRAAQSKARLLPSSSGCSQSPFTLGFVSPLLFVSGAAAADAARVFLFPFLLLSGFRALFCFFSTCCFFFRRTAGELAFTTHTRQTSDTDWCGLATLRGRFPRRTESDRTHGQTDRTDTAST